MGENQYVIYFKMIVSGDPTKYDDVGCDGLYIESIEKTDEVAQLEADNKDVRKSNHTLYLRCQELEAENKRLQKAANLLYILTGEEYKKEGER